MDIVIVGGGIVGTAIAARLGDTDHDVTLLERSRIGGETTAASAGILLAAGVAPTPFDLQFRARSRSVYRRLFDRGPLEAERLEDAAEVLREHDVEVSFLSAAELERLGIDPAGFAGGLYSPTDSVCDSTAVASWFASCARWNGADVRTGVTVTDVRTRDRDGSVSAVETDDGRLQADCVINATGPWAPELNEMVGVSLPLGHTLGPMVALEGTEPIEVR